MKTRRFRRVSDARFAGRISYPKAMMSDRQEETEPSCFRPGNYIRTFRRRCGLTQQDMAFLFAIGDGTAIGRYERGRRMPSLRAALACQVILGAAVHDLFPDIYHEVEFVTRNQAHRLIEALRADGPYTERTRQKLAVLGDIVANERDAPIDDI